MAVKCKSWCISFLLIPWIISLLFSSSVSAQTSLSCGQIKSDSISSAGEKDSYTFSATVNDKVAIQMVRTSTGLDPYIELFDSSGSAITSAYETSGNYVILSTTITGSGTYKITISDFGNDETGNYTITWQKVNDPCNVTDLSCGQGISGSLSVVGEMDFYSYTASSEDQIIIYLSRTSGNFEPYLEIYDTTGAVVDSKYDSSGNTVSLSVTGGNYRIAVSDYGKDETGNYSILWQRTNNPCNVSTLNCGEAVSGSLSSATEKDSYSFPASANDKIAIHLVRTSGSMDPYLELYDGIGSITANYTTSENETIIDQTLTAGGTYTVWVSDYGMDETGNYAIIWQKLNDPCNVTSLSCGVSVSASLDTTAEHDFYSFTVAADDEAVVTLSRTSGNMDPYLELYDNTGKRLANQSSTGSSVTLTQSVSAGKTYTVFVSDSGNDETGNYSIKLQKNVDSCPEVSLSAPNGGEMIDAGYTYKITWTTGGSQGISSQEITLSTDGGKTFSDKIVTGLSSGEKSYTWSVSKNLHTTKGRIRIKVTDASGDTAEDESDADFIVFQYVTKSSVNYVYDKLNRLTQIGFSGAGTITYSYDAAGNRTSMTSIVSTTTTPSPSPTSTPSCSNDGDVNEDGKLTAKDALLAFECVLGKATCTTCQQSHADVNGNGKVTAADALCIFKAVLNGSSPTEPLSCE